MRFFPLLALMLAACTGPHVVADVKGEAGVQAFVAEGVPLTQRWSIAGEVKVTFRAEAPYVTFDLRPGGSVMPAPGAQEAAMADLTEGRVEIVGQDGQPVGASAFSPAESNENGNSVQPDSDCPGGACVPPSAPVGASEDCRPVYRMPYAGAPEWTKTAAAAMNAAGCAVTTAFREAVR